MFAAGGSGGRARPGEEADPMRAPTWSSRRIMVAAGAATVVLGTWAGVAAAITAGPYNPGQAGCPTYDNASTFNGVYPGCHSLQLLIQDGNGNTYAEAGTD